MRDDMDDDEMHEDDEEMEDGEMGDMDSEFTNNAEEYFEVHDYMNELEESGMFSAEIENITDYDILGILNVRIYNMDEEYEDSFASEWESSGGDMDTLEVNIPDEYQSDEYYMMTTLSGYKIRDGDDNGMF